MTAVDGGPTLLIAYDGSACSRHALQCAASLFREAQAYVATVWEPPPTPVGDEALGDAQAGASLDTTVADRASQLSDEGVRLGRAAGLTCDARPIEGSPIWRGLVMLAEELEADAIVIGSRGHSGIRSAVLGSVSRDLVHKSERPVLVVPDGKDAAETLP